MRKKSCVFILLKLFSVVCLAKELYGYFKKCVLNYTCSHSRTESKYNPKGEYIRSQESQLYQRDFINSNFEACDQMKSSV